MGFTNTEPIAKGKTIYDIDNQKLISMQTEQAHQFILDKLREGLPDYLTYHSVEHTLDVYQAAEYIGKQEGITADEMKLLLTAALYHDAGFLKGPDGHEEISCSIAEESLAGFGFTADDIERICGMIRATKIPQLPKNHLEEILGDADLDYLGRDDFFSTGEKLFAEFSLFGVVKNRDEWNRLQVRFLERHHYSTNTSLKLRQKKKDEHLEMIKSQINNPV